MASPASGIIIDRIRNAIIRGDLRAGQQLREAEIAERFNVSRIPIREALSQLEGEGWVTSSPHRGSVVADMSAEDIRELCEIRVDLESRALSLAIPNMDAATLSNAAAILKETESDPHLTGWVERNLAFHCRLYEPARRPRLVTLIRQLHLLTSRYLLMHAAIRDYRSRGQKEHRALLAACRKGDAKTADRLLREHILEVADLFEGYAQLRSEGSNW
jgi:DNA-binding GntR family transcriptional regulator